LQSRIADLIRSGKIGEAEALAASAIQEQEQQDYLRRVMAGVQ
jgi:hypothetical protein